VALRSPIRPSEIWPAYESQYLIRRFGNRIISQSSSRTDSETQSSVRNVLFSIGDNVQKWESCIATDLQTLCTDLWRPEAVSLSAKLHRMTEVVCCPTLQKSAPPSRRLQEHSTETVPAARAYYVTLHLHHLGYRPELVITMQTRTRAQDGVRGVLTNLSQRDARVECVPLPIVWALYRLTGMPVHVRVAEGCGVYGQRRKQASAGDKDRATRVQCLSVSLAFVTMVTLWS
jgi:hypothetical protein